MVFCIERNEPVSVLFVQIDPMDREMLNGTAQYGKSSVIFHQDTVLRIGADLVRAAQSAMAFGDLRLMRQFFGNLLERILQDGEALQPVRRQASLFAPCPGEPVFERMVMSTPDLRASIIGLHPLRPIPLHDHPGLWSAQRVLQGRVRVRLYDLSERQPSSPSLAVLERLEDRELTPGEDSMVAPAGGNIHGLSSLAGRPAVMLSVRTRPVNPEPDSWYFPVDALRDSLPILLCNRINTPGFKSRDRGVNRSW